MWTLSRFNSYRSERFDESFTDAEQRQIPTCSACYRHLYVLPLLTVAINVITIVTTYIMAFTQNHVSHKYFPYISHTAIHDPERAIFAEGLNVGAVLFGVTVLVRYLINREKVITQNRKPKFHWINISILTLGLVSAFGQGMVANFNTEYQKPPHYFGAVLGFGLGTLMCFLQSFLSYHFLWRKTRMKTAMFILQLIFSTSLFFLDIIFLCTKFTYKSQETSGDRLVISDHLADLYLTSTVSEFLMAVFLSLFLLTFCPEFTEYRLPHLRAKPKSTNNNDVNA